MTEATAPVPPPSLVQKLSAEAIGTFVLIVFGVGAAAFSGDYASIGLAFGIAIVVMVYAFGRISGGHFNPAVSVGAALSGRIAWKEAGSYIGAQVVGGLVGGLVLVLIVVAGDTGAEIGDDVFGANGFGDHGGFAVGGALIIEIVMTFIFVLTVSWPSPTPATSTRRWRRWRSASRWPPSTSPPCSPPAPRSTRPARSASCSSPVATPSPRSGCSCSHRWSGRPSPDSPTRRSTATAPTRCRAPDSTSAAPRRPCPATAHPTSTSSSGTSRWPATPRVRLRASRLPLRRPSRPVPAAVEPAAAGGGAPGTSGLAAGPADPGAGPDRRPACSAGGAADHPGRVAVGPAGPAVDPGAAAARTAGLADPTPAVSAPRCGRPTVSST